MGVQGSSITLRGKSSLARITYVERLGSIHVRIRMSSAGNSYDNAKAESVFKLLKQEKIYLKYYPSFQEAEAHIKHCIEDVYNTKRFHSSLGYMPPVEFEMA